MDLAPQPTRKPRRDGWTPARLAQFLEHLADGCNVKRACALVGMSRQKAYALRTRDAAFARAWDEAQREAPARARAAFLAALPENLLRTMSTLSGECHLTRAQVAAGGSDERRLGTFSSLNRVTPGPCVSPLSRG
ncbi:MAG: hypothetical protein ACO1OD_12095 [Croceibacterium sp.]